MANVRVVWNEENFAALVNGPIKADTEQRARRVRRTARALAPKRSRDLERSIDYTIEGRRGQGWVARIGTDLYYAGFVHDGTGVFGPYGTPIRPHGRVMMWQPEGESEPVFARQVRGQPGRQFLLLAIEAFR